MKTFTALLFFSFMIFSTSHAQFGFSTNLGIAVPAGSFYTDASIADGEQFVRTGFHQHYNMQYHFIKWLGASISFSRNRHTFNQQLLEQYLEGQEPRFDWEVESSNIKSYYLLVGPSFGIDIEGYALFFRPGVGYSLVSSLDINYEVAGLDEHITARTYDSASGGFAWGATLSFVAYLTDSIGLNLDARFMNADMYRRVRGEIYMPDDEPMEFYDEDVIFRPLTFTGSLGLHFKF